MIRQGEISAEIIKQLAEYVPETGKLFWKMRSESFFKNHHDCSVWNTRYAGKIAFNEKHGDYYQGRLFYKRFMAHRIIWAIVHGKWPNEEIDHINGIGTDNRVANLREVSRLENVKNTKCPDSSKSQIVGVRFNHSKWEAQIMVNRKNIYLGNFDNINDAKSARKDAEIKYGFHPNHGR